MMRTIAVALSLTVLAIAAAPIEGVEAAPPNLPPGATGCDYFHWHNGNVLAGETPGYHYHLCYDRP